MRTIFVARNDYKKTSYLGVSYQEGKYTARFSYKGKQYYVGAFFNEIEAVMAYDKQKIEVIGVKAKTNESLGLLREIDK